AFRTAIMRTYIDKIAQLCDKINHRTETRWRMADGESDYKVGPGRPPLHTRFKKGQSGNPGGSSTKSLPALLAVALDETVVVTIDGRRRKITKREAIVTQMVDKSASADLRATKMLIDMMKGSASCKAVKNNQKSVWGAAGNCPDARIA